MSLVLSNLEVEQFQEALLDAFPMPGTLRQCVYFGLGVHLNQIVGGGTYREQVFDLVVWANANAQAEKLLREARKRVDGNEMLSTFERKLRGRLSEGTAVLRGEIQPSLAPPSAAQLEQLIFGRQRDTRLAYAFVEGAMHASRAVAQLMVPRIVGDEPDGGVSYGTGWLIAPGLLVTNHHVVEARDHRPKPQGLGDPPADRSDVKAQVKGVVAWFDYHQEAGNHVTCCGATLVADNLDLDYAIIELTEADKIADRAPLRIARQALPLERGNRLNIVQYAQRGPLRLAIRNNFYVSAGTSDAFIRYQTDTEPGASGSPVCDDLWRVVALHHASVDVPAEVVPQEVVNSRPVEVTVLNEAITLDAILTDLPEAIRQRVDTVQHQN